ncbi:MAG: hypothetical protein M3Y57_09915, partial [Acidobacteriota bacterium]|nr:hypothetical protein [Acidobacteriota bacterium]
ADYRSGVQWLSFGLRDPHYEYLHAIDQWFTELEAALPVEIETRLAEVKTSGQQEPNERGAVWTYMTTDQPFGTWTERILHGFYRKFKSKAFWG